MLFQVWPLSLEYWRIAPVELYASIDHFPSWPTNLPEVDVTKGYLVSTLALWLLAWIKIELGTWGAFPSQA